MNYEKICEIIGARPVNLEVLNSSPKFEISGLESLPSQNPKALCFFFSQAYKEDLTKSTPGLLVTAPDFVEPIKNSGLPVWKKTLILEVKNPYFALAEISKYFAEQSSKHAHVVGSLHSPSIHKNSYIHESSKIHQNVSIGLSCVIEEGVEIDEGVVLYPGVYVGPHSKIGKNSVLFPKVTLYENTHIGENVRIHAGVVIGADGFGYAPEIKNNEVQNYIKIYHIGNVIIGNNVEIGANSCIDRGTMGSTLIGENTKIDNHVQIGHNVKIGKGCVICGNVGIAGSAILGDYVTIAGMSAINNKVIIHDRAVVGPVSVISKNVAPHARVRGYPQRDEKDHLLVNLMINKLFNQFKKEKTSKKRNNNQDGKIETS